MTSKLAKLIADLRKLRERIADPADFMYEEDGHSAADWLLVDYINDPQVTQAFNDIPRWYS